VYSGYKELDAKGLSLVLGKTYETEFNSIDELTDVEPSSLLQRGITNLKLSDSKIENKYSPVLFNIILNNIERKEELKEEAVPNFILCDGRKFKYAVINGFLIKASSVGRKVGNALIFK
jgi:hypothetical protein